VGRLGVFWHTQGSGKSYSMAFFTEKVRRTVSAKFTFLLMTDRNDLDDQIFRTFVGCGAANEKTPRATSGDDLKQLLQENHRYLFSLIHKFNQDVDPRQPYSRRDDIIVISDTGGKAGAEHAVGVAERVVHRVYRDAVVPVRPPDAADFRGLCLAL
jgi:type I restriction enzyme R subunit